MIRFENDYSSGAAPEILEALAMTNTEGNTGYGLDHHTAKASELILRECGLEAGNVFFLTGGTQTNAVALDWLCRPGEGVVCTEEAHINVHECGAIENCGIKVIALPSDSGKLRADDVDKYMDSFYSDPTWTHRVRPSAVYISQPTELGTLYSKEEMTSLRRVCDKYNMALYLDGARLSYALASGQNDLTLPDVASLCDFFYFGGTKTGTLFGEALVATGTIDTDRFFSHIKRHGALLAKGWLTGVQFERLLTDSLYLKLARHALEVAQLLKKELLALGYREAAPSATNQLFFEMDDASIAALEGKVAADVQNRLSRHSHLVRFVTDWTNTPEDVASIAEILTAISE